MQGLGFRYKVSHMQPQGLWCVRKIFIGLHQVSLSPKSPKYLYGGILAQTVTVTPIIETLHSTKKR